MPAVGKEASRWCIDIDNLYIYKFGKNTLTVVRSPVGR